MAIRVLGCVLLLKVFASILIGFRDYFPPRFDDGFLVDREAYFYGIYQWAFYLHIVAAPISLALATTLFLNGNQLSFFSQLPHRTLGRTQAAIVMIAVVPSGIVMSFYAATGWKAGLGLFLLALATATTLTLSILEIKRRRFIEHARWSTRCFILLLSPLLLRIVNGFLITLQVDSPIAYQINSWASWLVPWIAYEAYLFLSQQPKIWQPIQFFIREVRIL